MAALIVPGVTLLPDDSWPFQSGENNTATGGSPANFSFIGPDNGSYLLLGLDVTAGPDQPVQTFLVASLAGVPFYRDSQSTGEGLGVTYSWRGQLPMTSTASLGVTLSTNGPSIGVGFLAWGIQINRPIAGT